MTTTTTLAGRWLHILKGDYSRCGQITMAVGTGHYLVRFRPPDDTPSLCSLLTIEELCDDAGADYFVAHFETEAELDAWTRWMEEPHDDGRPRVVRMNQETGEMNLKTIKHVFLLAGQSSWNWAIMPNKASRVCL